MAKRSATSELNHDNWNEEEESETPGTFQPISESELKNRIIKKAKRSLGNKETSGVSPFAAFSGFSSTGNATSNSFGFSKKNTFSGDGNSSLKPPKIDEKKENGSSTMNEEKKTTETVNTARSSDLNVSNKQKPTRSIEYYRNLQSLNESLMEWMQLHISKNACCDFTPVFNDYKKHLDTLNFTYPVRAKQNDSEDNKDFFKKPSKENTNQKSNDVNHELKAGNNVKKDDETDYGAHFSSNTTNTSTFSFGMKRTPSATSTSSFGPTTSLREEEKPEKKSFQFSFGNKNNQEDSNANKPFSFASAPIDKTADSEAATGEPEYMPPKNDFVSVKEEDAFYSKRCKLFFKKDDGYAERGVGMLHLKPLDGKTQLLIRADTSLGNILLNIILSSSLPMSRTGKNNVLLVCVPNPPLDSKKSDSKEAIPMLIRVKTSEDADELLETLIKHKS